MPILDAGVFDAVQAKLDENRRGTRERHQGSKAMLLGKLFDDRGNPMTPSYAIKKGVRYRYYVSCVLAQSRKEDAGTVNRVVADEVERIVSQTTAGARPTRNLTTQDARRSADGIENGSAANEVAGGHDEILRAQIEKVVLRARSVDIELHASDIDPAERLSIPWTPHTFRRKREVIAPTSQEGGQVRPMRWLPRTRLISAIAKARRWLDEIISGQIADIEAIATREGLNERTARMTLSLAFLAPDIVKAAVDGTLPSSLGVSRLIGMPANWVEQRRTAGLTARS